MRIVPVITKASAVVLHRLKVRAMGGREAEAGRGRQRQAEAGRGRQRMGRRPEAAEKEVDIKLYATCRRLPDLPSSTNTDSRAAKGGLSCAGASADQH